ncbi:MAG: hypothetical protein ABFS46_10685 [Myxococcota bacterium]
MEAPDLLEPGTGSSGAEPETPTVPKLPPIQAPARIHCRSCRREDRPVFSGLCGWCSERD